MLLSLREASFEAILAAFDKFDFQEASIQFSQLAIPEHLQCPSITFVEQYTQSSSELFARIDGRRYAVPYHENAIKRFLQIVDLKQFLLFTEYARIGTCHGLSW